MRQRFDTYEVALGWAAVLRLALERIGRADADLGRQLRRSAASVVLNLAEGSERRGKDRIHLYRVASGSLAETVAGLSLGLTWGFLESRDLEAVEALADRLRAMLYRLTHPRG